MVKAKFKRKGRRNDQAILNTRNLMAFIGVSVVGVVLLVDYMKPENVYYRQQQAIAKRVEADSKLAEVRAKADAQVREAEADKANKRYRTGCNMQMAQANEGAYERQIIALSGDMVPRDHVTGEILSPKAVVCDDKGNTAIVGPTGRLIEFATASDTSLVNQRVADAAKWHPKARRSAVGAVAESSINQQQTDVKE